MEDAPSVLERTRRDAARRVALEGLVFDGHRGWLHYPKDAAGIHGAVILCQSVGREARNGYRPLWQFAETIAAAGFAVLRYDHLGTGDSLPFPDTGDAWSHWLHGLEQAADWIRRETNAPALVLGGLRLGASLAALAAPRVRADGLILFAPAEKGKVWLRELRIETALLSGQTQSADGNTDIDGNGLWLDRAAVSGIAKFDLGRLDTSPPQVFLAAQGGGEAIASHFESLGAQVRLEDFDEYHALFKDAYLNESPVNMFGHAASWLRDVAKDWPVTPATFRRPAAALRFAGGSEEAVAFGEGLQGVLCRPDFPAPEKKAVLIANTGGDPKAGIGGFATEMSRTLAGRGIASLRFDFAGLGDSAFDGSWRSHVYETPRDGDFDAAVSLLQSEGFANIVAAGICSGGYHALCAASRDTRIGAAYAVNTAVLAWRNGDPLQPPENVEGWGKPWLRDFKHRLLSFRNWQRLFSGDIAWRAVLSSIALRLKRRLLSRLDGKLTNTLRARMRQLSKRGGQVRVVVGVSDASLDELETHFGRNGKWLQHLPGMSVGIIEGLDHGLFFRQSRRLALQDLVSYVETLSVTVSATEDDPQVASAPQQAMLTTAHAQ